MCFHMLLFLSLLFMHHTHKSVGDGTCSYIWDFMLHCSLSEEENIFFSSLPNKGPEIHPEPINVLYIYLYFWQERFKYF